MNSDAKVSQLRQKIQEALSPLIDGDCILLEVPHHANVGDFLIWEGERQFLKSQSHRCIATHSDTTFDFPKLRSDTTILMNGGGSFGDVWLESLEFKLKVVKSYPSNKIIFFPQSVEFLDDENANHALAVFKKHKNLIVCARDAHSFDFLSSAGIKTALVPDMAFFIRIKKNSGHTDRPVDALLVQREDREKKATILPSPFRSSITTKKSDWPTVIEGDRVVRAFSIFEWVLKKYQRAHPAIDFLANGFYRKHIIRSGMRLIDSAREIHATRLHAGILGILLNKQVFLYENSYGKLGRFYRTWLSDCDSVEMKDYEWTK